MNNQEGLEYIRRYFDEIFTKRNIDALDDYLDRDYHDDDIPDPQIDHIKNSKEYILNLCRKYPTIDVFVKDAIADDDVITAFLEWYTMDEGVKQTIAKGIGIFGLREKRIIKRHTYIYYEK